MKLEGKVALVTGASRGIGRAIAEELAAEGATVAINYNGSREAAEEVAAKIQENGGKASVFQCSVADPQAVEAMMKQIVSEYGRLDILVNNAGITRDNLIPNGKSSVKYRLLKSGRNPFSTFSIGAGMCLKAMMERILQVSDLAS